MPVHVLDEPVDVLQKLPREPALADPGLPGDGDEPDAPLPGRGVVEVLQEAQLVVASHERRLERLGATAATALGHDPQGAPRGHGRDLALQELLAGRLEHDRARGRVHRGLAREDHARRGRGLEPAGRVHHVPGDHALAHGTNGDGRLAGDDAGAGLDGRPQPPDGGEELQGGPDRSLGVVLVARRRSPDGHDRVPDELLDRAAVALDDPAGQLEVPRQEIPHLLGIAVLGERREAHEVCEEHRDEPALGDRGGGGTAGLARGARAGWSAGRGAEPAAALAAELGSRRVRRAAGDAHRGQRLAAVQAELAPRVVRHPTTCTGHEDPPRLSRPP